MSDTPTLPTCACGRDRRHPLVIPEPVYLRGGCLVWGLGMGKLPDYVNYRCRQCGEVFDKTTDVAIRRQYR